MKLTTLQDYWNQYRALTIPANAPRVQIQETRRAFYFGASAIMALMAGIEDKLTEDEAAALMERWNNEIEAFIAQVGAGGY